MEDSSELRSLSPKPIGIHCSLLGVPWDPSGQLSLPELLDFKERQRGWASNPTLRYFHLLVSLAMRRASCSGGFEKITALGGLAGWQQAFGNRETNEVITLRLRTGLAMHREARRAMSQRPKKKTREGAAISRRDHLVDNHTPDSWARLTSACRHCYSSLLKGFE